MDPFQLFNKWYDLEFQQSWVKIPSACCLSTIGLDDYPNSRFVSLKEVKDDGFVVTGPLSSRKGQEIRNDNKVALGFWWTVTEKQVRIQGEAFEISGEEAGVYFSERRRDSQIVSLVSQQGEEGSLDLLNKKYSEMNALFENKTIPKPADWGGWLIKPLRMEFMLFNESRFHERVLFEKMNGQWTEKLIQP